MAPHFGPGIIGHKSYDKIVAEEKRTASGRFGELIIGKRKSAREGNAFGPIVVGEGLPDDISSLSVKDLKDLLGKDSGLAGELFAAEKTRPDGARVGALRALQFAEAKNENPDEDALAEMKSLIDGNG